jgi:hypothetical protein
MLPEAFAQQHPASRADQPAQRVQRIDGVLRRLGLAEHVAGADAQDQVGRPARRPDGRLLDERDPAVEPARQGVALAPPEVGGAEVDAGADRPRHRFEDAEQQLAPATAEVEHRVRTRHGRPFDETRGSGLGQRAVEGKAGKTRRKVGSHRSDPIACGVLMCCGRFPLLESGAVWFAAISVFNHNLA